MLAELERRAAFAWWRRSFSHWPLLARAAFLLVSAVLIRLALLEGAVAVAGVRSLHQSGMLSLSWAQDVGVLAATAGNLITLLARMCLRPGPMQASPQPPCCTPCCSAWAPRCTALSIFSLTMAGNAIP